LDRGPRRDRLAARPLPHRVARGIGLRLGKTPDERGTRCESRDKHTACKLIGVRTQALDFSSRPTLK